MNAAATVAPDPVRAPYAETPVARWVARMEQDSDADTVEVTLSGEALRGVWETCDREESVSVDEVIDRALRHYFAGGAR